MIFADLLTGFRLFARKKREYEHWREEDWEQLWKEIGDTRYWVSIPAVPVFQWYLSRKKLIERKDQSFETARVTLNNELEAKALQAEETRLRYRQDNPHIEFLMNLDSEKWGDVALRFLEIHMKIDIIEKKAREEAIGATSKVFRDHGGELPDKGLIAGTTALRYCYKVFRKPNRLLMVLVMKDKKRWPENIENLIIPYLFVIEDMCYLGPVRQNVVKKAQDEIVEVILMLEERGNIIIAFDGEDVLVYGTLLTGLSHFLLPGRASGYCIRRRGTVIFSQPDSLSV